MIKLFVEDVMHLVGIVLELMYLKNGVSKLDGMLEARARQLFILDHKRADQVKLFTILPQEALHNTVLVFVDFVVVEVFVLLN